MYQYRDLNLSAEQKQKVDALTNAAREALVALDFGGGQTFRDTVGQLHKDIESLLTDEQKAKLKEQQTPHKPQP